MKEVKGLKCVKDEISQILIHINCEDPTIEAVNSPAAIHHLRQIQNVLLNMQETFKWCER